MSDQLLERAEIALARSMAYAASLGLATFDPFDTKGSSTIVWTFEKATPLRKAVRSAVYAVELLAPFTLRRMMGIPKKITAGGVGRLAQAHMARYRISADGKDLTAAEDLLKWLLEHPGQAPKGLGWGVPFEWSTYFGDVPANTAVSHTTQACGHAFLDFHDLTGQSWAIDAAHSCCSFVAESLNQTIRASGAVALSYTPSDSSQVVNISAEGAAFLLRAGRPADQPLVWKLGQFVAECQADDGSFPYSAPGSVDGANPIDHYHTGMVLSGLNALSSDPKIQASLERGLSFHLHQHFLENGCPRMRPSATYPVDSYSAGESILVLTSILRSQSVNPALLQESKSTLDKLVAFTLDNLAYPDGGFVYRQFKGKKLRLNSLRWSQALLCHALAEYVRLKHDASDEG